MFYAILNFETWNKIQNVNVFTHLISIKKTLLLHVLNHARQGNQII